MDISKLKADDLLKCEGEKIEFISNEEIEKLLCKVGPEGLYKIAEKLIDAADRDINEAIRDSVR